MSEPHTLSLSEASERIHKGQLSVTELVRSALTRIEQVEPQVLAWARTDPAGAVTQAERLDRALREGRDLGPLHGIPIGVKDIYYTAGVETAAGSKVMAGFVPDYDATVVTRLHAAGAIVLGKTHTTEFAMLDPAPTRNPWGLGHTPGGSSSGSAAAVAAGMCLGSVGSQTAGSILRPAAFCGVVGLKPTYGRVSRYGIVPVAWSLDHAGPLARTVRDVALLLEAMAGPDPHDSTAVGRPLPPLVAALTSSPRSLTAGVPDRYFTEGLDPAVASAFQDGLKVLEGIGIRVREARLPESFEAGVEAGRLIMHAEGAAVHLDWYRTRARDYRPKVRALIEAGLLIPAVSYLRAQQVRAGAIAAMRELFTEIDVLVTPTTQVPAPAGLGSTGDPIFNAPFSTFGLPALSVPMGFTPSGLPLGLQLVGRPFDEATVLQAGAAYEAATDWHRRRPPL
ncbi:MAG: amidase [Deltaproteobacteria bacterium]|nr:amidase [Deltaproteobacteria bacterium]MBI3079401.1 amidase [Deltaproteobacteria bacterium]